MVHILDSPKIEPKSKQKMLVIDDQGEDSPVIRKEDVIPADVPEDPVLANVIPPIPDQVEEAAPKLDIPRPSNIMVENDYAS